MKRKLRCILVDDDPLCGEVIKDYLNNSDIAELTQVFLCPKVFLSTEPKLHFDLCLLDICMPDFSGFAVAEELIKRNRHFIFISGQSDMVINALKMVEPIDVVPKPTNKLRLHSALQKAHRMLDDEMQQVKGFDYYHVLGKTGKIRVQFSDIIYARTYRPDRRHKEVVLKGGTGYILMDCCFEEILAGCPNLIRINKSEIISIEECSEIDQDLITLKGILEDGKPKHVTLNRWFRKDFLARKFVR